jgi:hypothetical protein
MLDNLGLYFITHFFGKHKAYTKIKGGYWIGVLGSVWFKREEGRGGIFNEGEGREGEIFNYLYVWFKRGEGRGGKKF